MESEGLASNFRAVAEAEAAANRSAMNTLIRARSLGAKEIPVERVRDTRCVRTARRDRGASDLGRSRCVPVEGVHAASVGPKSRRERRGYKAMPKCSADAQREVRSLVVVRKRRENDATRA